MADTHLQYMPFEVQEELRAIVKKMVDSDKGILVADEPKLRLSKSFEKIEIKSTPELRQQYRQILFTTDYRIADSISSIFISEEALHRNSEDGAPYVELLEVRGLVFGVTADRGFGALDSGRMEFITQGLDDLQHRCMLYKEKECGFVKWRCVFSAGSDTPSHEAIVANVHALARFAYICQKLGLVAVLSVEVLRDNDHDLQRTQQVTESILAAIYKALQEQHVFLEGTFLRLHMVTPGRKCTAKYTLYDVAFATVQSLRRTVPAAVPGIAFLLGEQNEEDAITNLNIINNVPLFKPWLLTFCYGCDLQDAVFRAWGGKTLNVHSAQNLLVQHVKTIALATRGRYERGSFTSLTGKPVFVANKAAHGRATTHRRRF